MSGYAGVDWAKEEHALCVVDGDGSPVLEARFAHDERGLGELCRTLASHGARWVAVERPEGPLVERLLEAGLVVFAIHPNQAKAARPRFRAAGGKSDAFDAFVLSWRNSPAPTATASGRWCPTPMRPKLSGF